MIDRLAVVLPTWHRPLQLTTALGSVLDQDVDVDLDVVVVEDGPQPENDAVLASLDDPRVRRVTLPEAPDRGVPNRELALQTVEARWVAYLEDDDVWLPGHVSALIEAARTHDRPLCVSRPVWVAGDGSFHQPLVGTGAVTPERLGSIPISSVLHRIDELDAVGGWPLTAGDSAEAHLWTDMVAIGATLQIVPFPTALHLPASDRPGRSDSERAAEQRRFAFREIGVEGVRDLLQLLDKLFVEESARTVSSLRDELGRARQHADASARVSERLAAEAREARNERDTLHGELAAQRARLASRAADAVAPLARALRERRWLAPSATSDP